jgi:hypothetical protein
MMKGNCGLLTLRDRGGSDPTAASAPGTGSKTYEVRSIQIIKDAE